ncbi:tetratricopeptide repeat protein [Aggregicoccus sp. 17bor-14]|uniref:zinc-ribbon domain-containing protein n=1 Tax=Myxococcaceae TaxID=31 RepID=UPI00129CE98B|nr:MULTISPECIES: zinc-ribbon domain-containing protein [Myxococcaceae]MBF5041298.1 zinc-ribbon domain-containing protein [Simulacricoccus sp. 17bor-14]MRI87084.1 tetratricopeptide repeat protein [Aggregicoccus sp. 17bor-14]
MRIVCQSCSAAYAIDDRHVTPRGVRAQCPRCRHQQVVRREPDAATAPPAQSPAAPPPAPERASAAPPPPAVAPVPLAPSARPRPEGPPERAQAARPRAPESPRPAPAAGAPAPEPRPGPAPRTVAPPPQVPVADSPPPGLGSDDLAFQDLAPEDPAQPPPSAGGRARRVTREQPAAPVERLELPVACDRCGGRLEDPVSQALGTCEACRSAAEEASASTPTLRIPLGAAPSQRGAGSSPPGDARTERTLPMAPIALQRDRPGVRWPRVLAAAGLGVLVLGGAAAYMLRERARTQREAAREQPLPQAVQAVLPRWRLMHVDVQGSAAQQLAEGTRLMAQDEQGAYLEAEEAFQRALLLDPKSDAAIAGYVRALALGRGAALEQDAYAEALALIQAAKGRAGANPAVQLACAALLQTRAGDTEQERARQLAEAVLAAKDVSAADQAEAHRVLGHGYAHGSFALATQHFDEALALNPKLVIVHRERALAAEAAGDYRQAIAALERRLQLDPGHRESIEALARVLLEVGDVPRARALYESQARAYPKELRAQVPLAVLRYQVDGAPAPAVASLRSLLREREQQPARDVASALVHLAAAERAAGHAAQAERAADEALALDAALPAAHLQRFLLALDRRDAAVAAAHLAPARAGLADPALGQLLAGRLALLQAAPDKAREAFLEAYRLDARRSDALLLEGLAAASAGQREDAARVLAQVLQADPLRPPPRPVVTDFYLQPHELLRGVDGALAGLRSGPEDMVPDLYAGALRFYQGQLPEADALLQRVLARDLNNAQALAYRALVALERGGTAGAAAARPLAERAVAQDRRYPVAQLALGLALAAQGKAEPAQRALREALALSPSLLSAEVRLAQLEAGSSVDSARTRLLRTVGLDPAYLVAKRALFALEQ